MRTPFLLQPLRQCLPHLAHLGVRGWPWLGHPLCSSWSPSSLIPPFSHPLSSPISLLVLPFSYTNLTLFLLASYSKLSNTSFHSEMLTPAHRCPQAPATSSVTSHPCMWLSTSLKPQSFCLCHMVLCPHLQISAVPYQSFLCLQNNIQVFPLLTGAPVPSNSFSMATFSSPMTSRIFPKPLALSYFPL